HALPTLQEGLAYGFQDGRGAVVSRAHEVVAGRETSDQILQALLSARVKANIAAIGRETNSRRRTDAGGRARDNYSSSVIHVVALDRVWKMNSKMFSWLFFVGRAGVDSDGGFQDMARGEARALLLGSRFIDGNGHGGAGFKDDGVMPKKSTVRCEQPA